MYGMGKIVAFEKRPLISWVKILIRKIFMTKVGYSPICTSDIHRIISLTYENQMNACIVIVSYTYNCISCAIQIHLIEIDLKINIGVSRTLYYLMASVKFDKIIFSKNFCHPWTSRLYGCEIFSIF